MRILVTGGFGFIGAAIVAALRDDGHAVVVAVRGARVRERGDGVATIACDFARDVDADAWHARLDGIDAIVNVAGILRERAGERFDDVHHRAPAALARAAAARGITRFVQVSALGSPADDAFVASKHRGDAAILAALPDAVILRPGLTYAARGAYGGTSLLRALAVLPVVPLPAGGTQPLQPVALADVVLAVRAALADDAPRGETIELVGPEVLTLRAWLARWRAWLGAGPMRAIALPPVLADFGIALGERFGRGPVGRTTARLLARGVVGSADALVRQRDLLHLQPRAPAVEMRTPAQAADRQHARLYFLLPLLRVALALLWIGSGVLGLALAGDAIVATMRPPGWSADVTLALARAGAVVDVALGVALLAHWRPRPVLLAMLAQVLVYTLLLGIAWPALWLDPWGGLAKNIVVVAAVLAAHAGTTR